MSGEVGRIGRFRRFGRLDRNRRRANAGSGRSVTELTQPTDRAELSVLSILSRGSRRLRECPRPPARGPGRRSGATTLSSTPGVHHMTGLEPRDHPCRADGRLRLCHEVVAPDVGVEAVPGRKPLDVLPGRRRVGQGDLLRKRRPSSDRRGHQATGMCGSVRFSSAMPGTTRLFPGNAWARRRRGEPTSIGCR